MPTVVRAGSIELKVYPQDNQRRHVPHFHVWVGGESVATVRLSSLEPWGDVRLSRKVRDLITDNLDLLADAWDELHA